ncbi:MAG: AbrB/MazE/SpoVT family DNA-binding domain-containing protein [Patescibacteria group bacterium]
MITQTIYQVGNSVAVTIPRNILEEMNLKIGQEVVVEKALGASAVVISPVVKAKTNALISADFKRWLSSFLEEDKDLLAELANR